MELGKSVVFEIKPTMAGIIENNEKNNIKFRINNTKLTNLTRD